MPTIHQRSNRKRVGTLRFAHPTKFLTLLPARGVGAVWPAAGGRQIEAGEAEQDR